MIKISKEEKFALVAEHPELEKEIVRTMRQCSSRHNYFVTYSKTVSDFLKRYWDGRIIKRLESKNG